MKKNFILLFFLGFSLISFAASLPVATVSPPPMMWGFDKTYGNNGIVDVGGNDIISKPLGLRKAAIAADGSLSVLAAASTDHPKSDLTTQPALFRLDQHGKLLTAAIVTNTNLINIPRAWPLWVGFQSKGNVLLKDNYQFLSDLKTQQPFVWSPEVKLRLNNFQVLSDDTILTIIRSTDSAIDTIQLISSIGNSIISTASLGSNPFESVEKNIIHPSANAIARLSPCIKIYDRQGVLLKDVGFHHFKMCDITNFKPHPDGGFVWVESNDSTASDSNIFEEQGAILTKIQGGMLRRLDKTFNLDSDFERCTPQTCPCFYLTGHYFDYAVQQDGKYVVANLTKLDDQPITSWPLELARCNLDGSYDTGFGSGGRMLASGVGGESFLFKIQPDNKILVVSNLYEPNLSFPYLSRNAIRIMRFAPITATRQTFLPIVR